MLKKLLILIILLAVILIGFLVYNLFFKKTPQPESTTGDKSTTEAPKIKLISQEKVTSYDLTPGRQKIRYYLAKNGNIFEVDFDGQNAKQISSALLPNLLKVIFSPLDKEKTIVILEEEGQARKYFYDYKLGKSSQLHQNIEWLSFSPDGQQIAYQFRTPATNTISLANPDGTDWKNIFTTRLEDLILQWPTQDKIGLLMPGTASKQGALYTVNNDGSNFNKIIGEIYGLAVKWSPKGDRLIFSSTDENGKNLKLNLAEANGKSQKILNIVTLPEKCAWSQDSKNIFCAAPQETPPYISWPDDYKKRTISTEDDFYKIDLLTNQKTKLATSTKEKAFDAKDLILSPKEDYLFFINQRDGLLYSLEL